MRCVLVVCLIAGCDFAAAPLPGPGSHPGGDPTDPGSGPGSDPGAVAKCDVSDPMLRLCLTFDHTPMVADLSAAAHGLADPVSGVGSAIVGTPVAVLGRESNIRFADAPDFDVDDMTVDLWMFPGRIMRHQSFWMFDNDTQYFASYEDDGRVRCGIGGTTVTSRNAVSSGWHHIACRYNAMAQQLRVYVDGSVSECTSAAPIPKGGNDGFTVGAQHDAAGYHNHFEGALDAIHLYARTLMSPELCAAAGRSGGCNPSCPSGGDGGGSTD
jgi:hypothetical protein